MWYIHYIGINKDEALITKNYGVQQAILKLKTNLLCPSIKKTKKIEVYMSSHEISTCFWTSHDDIHMQGLITCFFEIASSKWDIVDPGMGLL